MPQRIDAEAEEIAGLVQSVKSLWPCSDVRNCIPREHPLMRTGKISLEDWTPGMLRALEAIAKVSRSGNMRSQARYRAWMTIKEQFQKHVEELDGVGDVKIHSADCEEAFLKAKKLYTALWPNTTYSSPDVVENFGAWEQDDAATQAKADGLTLEAYRNAINGRGAASGNASLGPTISTSLTANKKRDWVNATRVEGELWRTPERPVKGGYGNMRKKRMLMAQIEARFQLTMSQFLGMEDLRPEDAYCIPAAVLHGIVLIGRDFPEVSRPVLFKLLIEEKAAHRLHKKSTNGNKWFNIAENIINNVHKKIEDMRKGTTPNAGGASAALPAAGAAFTPGYHNSPDGGFNHKLDDEQLQSHADADDDVHHSMHKRKNSASQQVSSKRARKSIDVAHNAHKSNAGGFGTKARVETQHLAGHGAEIEQKKTELNKKLQKKPSTKSLKAFRNSSKVFRKG